LGRGVQRRGVHVSTPKIGSRGGEKCFGGIQRFYAELRRELCWGDLRLDFFWVLFEVPRGTIEEGGHYVFRFVFLGGFGTLLCERVGELFT
jgi:hypothetical protein